MRLFDVSYGLDCSAFSCELQTPCIITLWYNMCTARVSPLYSCMQCLKHYDLLFKYMNPLSYQIMIFVSLLHPHNPLTFVATTNFLSCMHTPSSPSPSLGILSTGHIHFFSLGRSPRVSTTPFRHTPIDKPLQRCMPATYTHTFNLLLYVSLPRVSHTVRHTCKLSPLFSSISQSHTPSPI